MLAQPSSLCTPPPVSPTFRTWKLCRDEFIDCLLRALDTQAAQQHGGGRPAIMHVGANLGFTNHNDPITKLVLRTTGLRVLLVEPQPSIATRLRNLSRPYPHVAVHNAAVCQRDAVVPFYEIDETKVRACLLYTSPSPRDRQKSRMPSSA